MAAHMLYLRVISSLVRDWLDLPKLQSIELGWSAFEFDGNEESAELVMRSSETEIDSRSDLPKLTTLVSIKEGGWTFHFPRRVILESDSSLIPITVRHA